jgi:hypothetical protein
MKINDLIGGAVSNAIARRNQVLNLEVDCMVLSDREAAEVGGGVTSGKEPLIAGGISIPPKSTRLPCPIVVGIIYQPVTDRSI